VWLFDNGCGAFSFDKFHVTFNNEKYSKNYNLLSEEKEKQEVEKDFHWYVSTIDYECWVNCERLSLQIQNKTKKRGV